MKPRIAFCGVGRQGRSRMQNLLDAHAALPTAYLDTDGRHVAAARAAYPAPAVEDLDALLDLDPDGIVIATPNELHAEQARTALEHGVPVFCDKPLALGRQPAEEVVHAAEDADVLLRVDWAYRSTQAFRFVRDALEEGRIGTCYRAELTFHHGADGRGQAGGPLAELGVHLLDALHWLMPEDRFEITGCQRFGQGRRVDARDDADHAIVALQGRTCSAQVQTSWNAPLAGQAEIAVRLHGTCGALRITNVGGSLYDLRAERMHGSNAHTIAAPPDAWSGRLVVDWAHQIGRSGFEPEAWESIESSRLLEEAMACAS